MSANRKRRPRPDRVREKLLKRLPPDKGRIAAFDKVHAELAIATEKFEHQGDGGRLGVFLAIDAMFNYFTGRGLPPATLEPLVAVSAAIVDAERGTGSLIFKPNRTSTGGAPPSPATKVAFEGLLAVIAEGCVRHCKAEGMWPYVEDATIMAARLVNASSWPTTVTATEMREIRERVRQQRNLESPDRVAFDSQTTSPVFKAMPLAWAKLLLDHEWVIVPPE